MPARTSYCWATDAALFKGQYYFYMSVGPTSIGVATAPSPRGPWRDALGRPLLNETDGKALKPANLRPLSEAQRGPDVLIFWGDAQWSAALTHAARSAWRSP